MSELVHDSAAEAQLPADAAPAVAAAPVVPDVGAVLRQAREDRRISVGEAAQILKISHRQVEALEQGDWAALPGQTFVRGFVRNYARFLHLDAEPLLAQLKADQTPENPNIVLPRASAAELPRPGQGKRRDLAAMAGAALMVGVAVAAYFVVPADFWQSAVKEEVPAEVSKDSVQDSGKESEPAFPPPGATESPASGAEATGAVPPIPAATVSPVPAIPAAPAMAPAAPTAAVPGGAPQAVASPPAAAVVATPAPAAVVPVAAPAGSGPIKLRFSQPSWVEVKDKTGQIVFSQLNPAGSEREVAGVPPFTLVVGNATHVKLTYKGRDISLEPRSKDDVARVTLD
jgi:cytoskeleton protein RodZ